MKQTVYVSGYLPKAKNKHGQYGASVFNKLQEIEEIEIKPIESHNENVWCRDFMPVKSASGKYVQFTYHPSYMGDMDIYKDKYPDTAIICSQIGLKFEPSEIILDGGAIEIFGKKGIVSDRVFRDNKDKSETEIYDEIRKKLDLDQLIVVPQYPYDFTGHVDGMLRFIDENRVVVNDLKNELEENNGDKNRYRKQLIENWIYAFKSALINAGLRMEELPTSIPEDVSTSSGEGIYINFLLLQDLIIMPVYGNDEDKIAADQLYELYGKTVKTVNAKELSQMGGMINCVTWTK